MFDISFITPIYNKSRYLPKVLESLKQIPQAIRREYIFIDDGSTDNSLEIVKSYTNNWPNVTIIEQSNRGPSIAVNRAIKLAKGEFVQFIDADDVILRFAPEILLNEARSNKVDVVFGRLGQYDPDQDLPLIKRNSLYRTQLISNPLPHIILGDIKGISAIGATKSLIRTSALVKIGGADHNVFSQDYSISLRLAIDNKFLFIDHLVALIPVGYAEEHLSNNKLQENYDRLLALSRFAKQYPDVAKPYSRLFTMEAASILWRQHLKDTGLKAYLSPEFGQYLISKITPKPELHQIYSAYAIALSMIDSNKVCKVD